MKGTARRYTNGNYQKTVAEKRGKWQSEANSDAGTVNKHYRHIFELCCSMYCFVSIVLFYALFVCKCVLLPPGVNQIAVKHIISNDKKIINLMEAIPLCDIIEVYIYIYIYIYIYLFIYLFIYVYTQQ